MVVKEVPSYSSAAVLVGLFPLPANIADVCVPAAVAANLAVFALLPLVQLFLFYSSYYILFTTRDKNNHMI